jgi:TrmH family RNA methyltransferase
VNFRIPTAVVLGNEARGVPADLDDRLDGHVTIPMAAPAESLNVAMAGTVLCFESARQRSTHLGAVARRPAPSRGTKTEQQ